MNRVVSEYLRCSFCRWEVPGPIDEVDPWRAHMAGAHREYWEKRNAVVAALSGHGTYNTNYPDACGAIAYIVLAALGLAPEFDATPIA